jgi:hypothetical protein
MNGSTIKNHHGSLLNLWESTCKKKKKQMNLNSTSKVESLKKKTNLGLGVL